MVSLPSTTSLLSTTMLLCFSYNSWCIWIILLGTASLLFEHIFCLSHVSSQLNALRVWFGRWCVMSSLVLIFLNLLLRPLVTLQLHLEKFTMLLLESLAIHQLFLIGVMGLVLLEWQEIYKLYCICWLHSCNRDRGPVQRAPLVAKLSPFKITYLTQFMAIWLTDSSLQMMDVKSSQPRLRGQNVGHSNVFSPRSSPRLLYALKHFF